MDCGQHMCRYHSYPVVTQATFISPKTYNSNAEIFLLPDTVMEIIFNHLSYTELSSIRCVCRWFYYVIGSMMNQKFLSLRMSIEREIGYFKRSRRKTNDGYLRILHILKSEVKMLEANCLDYIISNMFFFHGGKIFDCINQIMTLKNNSDNSHNVSELFVLIDNFLDNFDSIIEPEIIKRSIHLPFSWFGKKIVDTLECYTNFDYQLVLNPHMGENHCKLNGTYEAMDISSLSSPPVLSESHANITDMFLLLKYIRNHIRWNNVLNYINTVNNNFELFENKMWSQNTPELRIMYSREAQKNPDPANQQSLTVSLELFCHKVLAPLKCREHLGSLYVLSSNKKMGGGESVIPLDTIPLKSSDYELNVGIEMVFKDKLDESRYKVITIQICHVDDCCYIASNTDYIN